MAFQYWQHMTSGDVFAVEIADNTEDTVITACGPIPQREQTIANLPDFDYNTEDGEYVAATVNEWQAAEPSAVVTVALDGTRY